MRKNIDRVQVILTVFFFLDGIMLIAAFLFEKLLYLNYIGYVDMFILELLFIYTGYKHISDLNEEDQRRSWYKQPWILIGIITFILMILFLINTIFTIQK